MLHNWNSSWIKILPNDPNHVVGYNKRIDLTTGYSSLIETLYADISPVFSSDGEVRAKLWDELGKWHIAWRGRKGSAWHNITCPVEDRPVFVPSGHGCGRPRHIIVLANDQGNTSASVLLDPETDQRTLLAQRPKHDVWGMVSHGDRKTGPLAGTSVTSEPRTAWISTRPTRTFPRPWSRRFPGWCAESNVRPPTGRCA